MPEVGGEPNIPGWEQDPNGPFTSSDGPIEGDISLDKDIYLFHIRGFDSSGSTTETLEMQINGDTSGYEYVAEDGSLTTGASSWELAFGDKNDGFVGEVKLFDGSGGSGDTIVGTASVANVENFDGGIAKSITQTGGTGLNSFTISLSDGGTVEGAVEVFGRPTA